MASGITVMMNGLPGAMGIAVSQACLRRGMSLAPVALAREAEDAATECQVTEAGQTTSVKLLRTNDPAKRQAAVAELQAQFGPSLVIIDFTHPTAMNANAEVYTACRCPFVMGTTGGDKDAMIRAAEASGTFAVIAPNMGKQVVAFQATMAHMAKTFPGVFQGYKLDVVESHQSTKADVSGTAVGVVSSLSAMGVQHSGEDSIRKIRNPEEQLQHGVPQEALTGHAWHTYTLTSEDGSVQFKFEHNVCGRRTYAEGVADAVQFLAAKVGTGSTKRIFDMIDVLSEGAMH